MSEDLEGKHLTELESASEWSGLEKFFQNKGVDNLALLAQGHMNLSWAGQLTGREVICQFGPNLSHYQVADIKGLEFYGYFNPNKFVEAKEICKKAVKIGVSCPQVIEAGYSQELTRAWCILEKAEGVNLEEIWDKLPEPKRLKVLNELGQLLGRLHSIDVLRNLPDPKSWYTHWLQQVVHNLGVLGIYSAEELKSLEEKILPIFLGEHLPPQLTLIHGDILQKNIFVHPKTLMISGIIDWETAGIGNPWSDVILGAWWISGEYGGSKAEYETVIKGYNAGALKDNLALSMEKAQQMNPYLDLFWYLNILWVRPLMGDHSQTERRKGMVAKIMAQISGSES